MALIRIIAVKPLQEFEVELHLTSGTVIRRDLAPLLIGPVFEPVINDPALFAQVRAEAGTLVWPNGADLCPDVLIWGGMPPANLSSAA